MDVRFGLWRRLSAEEWMLLNCGVGEDSWESLGLQGDQPVHPKGDKSWVFIGRTDAEAETPILWPPHAKSWNHWKRSWFWEGLGAGGEEDDRGLDGWMASPTLCTWVWVDSRSWWWTGRPGVLQFMGSQSQIRLSDWTELKQDDGTCSAWHAWLLYTQWPSISFLNRVFKIRPESWDETVHVPIHPCKIYWALPNAYWSMKGKSGMALTWTSL